MSVIEYIYPDFPHQLTWECLEAEFMDAVPGVQIEWEFRQHATPNWSTVWVRHPRGRRVTTIFVVSKNTLAQKRDLKARYKRDAKLVIATAASHVIWSQLKVPSSMSDSAFFNAMNTHNVLIATLNREGRGVVDLPENGRLYSVVSFRRYVKRRSELRG